MEIKSLNKTIVQKDKTIENLHNHWQKKNDKIHQMQEEIYDLNETIKERIYEAVKKKIEAMQK